MAALIRRDDHQQWESGQASYWTGSSANTLATPSSQLSPQVDVLPSQVLVYVSVTVVVIRPFGGCWLRVCLPSLDGAARSDLRTANGLVRPASGRRSVRKEPAPQPAPGHDHPPADQPPRRRRVPRDGVRVRLAPALLPLHGAPGLFFGFTVRGVSLLPFSCVVGPDGGFVVSLFLARVTTDFLWTRNLDPDVWVLLLNSALVDLVGQLLLVCCYEIAALLGSHVRS
ncbi:hypothetical protein SCP_1701260 [Sparassis crispa]|uniref:Uncharacterized protein n=1 Tax=Sparassis crispa TaxID=139825 RepID=A0A401H5Y4_9APHY|nr:hypothetical protein SCP_1701260 [Sparassis crispa]GBE89801.1 hypothetical protein SCP_1701260 [Sparassis crispa]